MTTDQFTTDQFTAAIEASDTAFNDYPLVGMGGTAECFNAYDANLGIIVDGLYTEVLNQATVDRAIAIADAARYDAADYDAPDYDAETRAATDMLACVLAPIEAFMAADIPCLKGLILVILYIVTPAADGLTFSVQHYEEA